MLTLVPGADLPTAYVAYQTLVSFDAVLMCCETFTFMWTSHSFGILAITLVQMMIDLSLFLVFFSVIIVGFCLALLRLGWRKMYAAFCKVSLEQKKFRWQSVLLQTLKALRDAGLAIALQHRIKAARSPDNEPY